MLLKQKLMTCLGPFCCWKVCWFSCTCRKGQYSSGIVVTNNGVAAVLINITTDSVAAEKNSSILIVEVEVDDALEAVFVVVEICAGSVEAEKTAESGVVNKKSAVDISIDMSTG